ncbi:DUF3224 domain-containing protein [Occallatibacter savannae]|uniref:DUF3224 domain-containing protein n=1 Tax=Occallatibacter savannae TaxID=1002691 RepID=UPI001EF4E1BE|nr:DUF3224 domain-containing protein [Occallatibacter savannae]
MRRILVLSLIWLCAAVPLAARAQEVHPVAKDPLMPLHAEGTFEVKNFPLGSDEALNSTAIGRFGLDKQFHGDLEGTSKGEMLGAGNPATGTAGYVAIEQFTGTLNGHHGSFALQHFGTMEDNKFDLTVKVVPGSGTEDLIGINGTMTISVANGKHSWKFDYALPPHK